MVVKQSWIAISLHLIVNCIQSTFSAYVNYDGRYMKRSSHYRVSFLSSLVLVFSFSLLVSGCHHRRGHGFHGAQTSATVGQELLDLKKALDGGAIKQAEYDTAKKQVLKRAKGYHRGSKGLCPYSKCAHKKKCAHKGGDKKEKSCGSGKEECAKSSCPYHAEGT